MNKKKGVIFIETEEKSINKALDKVIELIEARLDYLIECQNGEDKTAAMGLVKTDELIKIAKLLKEMDEDAKMQIDPCENEETDEIRFVFDKAVKRLAK